MTTITSNMGTVGQKFSRMLMILLQLMINVQGKISMHHEIPITSFLELRLFDVWGLEFMRPLVISFCIKYILMIVDYMSKWVETFALHNNEGRSVTAFQKRIHIL